MMKLHQGIRMEQSGARNARRRRVILVPAPLQGHLNPMLSLGSILYSKGLSITIAYINFNSPDPSNHPDFQFQHIPFDPSELLRICNGKYLRLVCMMGEQCVAPFTALLSKIKENQDTTEKISCVIHDEFMFFSSTAASGLNVPSIILRTASPTTFVSRFAALHMSVEDQDSEELVPDHPYPIRFKDLPTSKLGALEDFLKLFGNTRNLRKSSAVVFNTMEFLERSSLEKIRQETEVPIFPIGPLHKMVLTSSGSLLEEDRSCLSWLDEQADNSVLYVSLGSIATVEENEIAEIAWGLANSKQPFIWVIRPGSIKGSEWIEKLPLEMMEAVGERGCFVKWAPQKEVLAHPAVGGFWSHCGWNSTMESLCEGVPMICLPFFGDQKVNSRCLSYVWKVGLELRENLERQIVEKAVVRLMVDNEGKEMRKQALNFKEKIKICTSEQGSSSKSLIELDELIMSF